MMKLMQYLATGLTSLFLCLGPASATTVLYQSFDDLVDNSEHVIIGTVSAINAEEYPTGDIFTVVTLNETSMVTPAGTQPLSRDVKIRYIGGTIDVIEQGEVVGRRGLTVDGTPSLTIGEKIVVFLRGNGVSEMPIVGWGQGVFRVDNNDGVRDHDSFPVLGLKGSDIQLGNKDAANASINAGTPGDIAVQRPDLPSVSASDGGEDIIIQKGPAAAAAGNAVGIAGVSRVTPINLSSFISLVKNRKIATADPGRPDTPSTNALHTLPTPPNLGVAMKDHRPDFIPPGNGAASFDETPVQPAKRPQVENNNAQ